MTRRKLSEVEKAAIKWAEALYAYLNDQDPLVHKQLQKNLDKAETKLSSLALKLKEGKNGVD